MSTPAPSPAGPGVTDASASLSTGIPIDAAEGHRTDPRTAAQDAVPAIRARELRRVFGTGAGAVTALDGVDLDVRKGEFTAIMGPSGSGKSTLLHVLAGLDELDSGSVQIDGTEITGLSDDDLTRLRRDRIGFVFQSFNLLPMLNAEQNVLLPLELAGRRVDRSWFDTVTGAFGLTDRLDHLPSQLSGGQIQRVAISRALVTSPAVVFADEPTGNLDSRTTEEVLDFLRLSVDQFGQTVVMVTHERDAAERADRIITLADGRISADEDLRGSK